MGFDIKGTPTEVKATGDSIEAVKATPVPAPTEPPKAEEKKAE